MMELSKKLTEREMIQIFGKDAARMKTHKDWINDLSKEELAFRLFGKFYSGRCCYQCVHYRKNHNGEYMCFSSDHESDCKDEYLRWLDEPMEE